MASLKLVFDDGHTEMVTARPLGLVAAERKWKGTPPQLEGSLFACWYGLHGPAGDPTFDSWLESIADIEMPSEETADPTQGPPPAE